MTYARSQRPAHSIWGPTQTADELLPGIWHVSTASHGGLILSDERQAAMPDSLRLIGAAYEEDVDWALVHIAFESEFRRASALRAAAMLQLAHDGCKAWRPDAYEAFTGQSVALAESHVRRAIAAHKALIGDYVVTTAYGDWADWVPKGKVGVVARRLKAVTHLGFAVYDDTAEPRHALVDAERYRARSGVTALDALAPEPC